jgi:predicted aldo/keto reductase-like oxidoreductase
MEHRSLGRTGVSVSKLCLGTMMFGDWGTKDHDESIRIIHRALGAGINFIDTADAYSAGESEVIVGKALAGGKRDDVVLATKVHVPMGDDPNQRGNSRRWIIREVENSLERLGTDWSDVYQIHRPDPDTDIDETLGARSVISCIRARSATSVIRPSPLRRSWRRSGPPNGGAGSGFAASSRPVTGVASDARRARYGPSLLGTRR